MKKSEKIEIRVSLAEKNALVQLASAEGRSVSQLVRDVIKKYAAFNMPNLRIRFSKLKIMALVSCGFILGVGGPILNGLKSKTQTYLVHGTINENGFSFPITGMVDAHKTLTIGNYSLVFHVRADTDNQDGKYALVSICRNQIEGCEKRAQAKLKLNSTPSVWQDGTSTEDVFLVIQPTDG